MSPERQIKTKAIGQRIAEFGVAMLVGGLVLVPVAAGAFYTLALLFDYSANTAFTGAMNVALTYILLAFGAIIGGLALCGLMKAHAAMNRVFYVQ